VILVYTHRQTATRHYNREFRFIEGRRDTTSHGHIHIEPVYDQNVFCFLLSYCNIILIYVCMLIKVFLSSFIKLLQYHIVSSFFTSNDMLSNYRYIYNIWSFENVVVFFM